MINVFILEDHLLIAFGLKHYFKGHKEITVVGWSNRINEAIRKIKELKPSIILLDLFIDKHDPIEVFGEISKNFPQLPIIMLTAENSFYWKCRMMKEGAHGFVTKNSDDETLTETILKVATGQKVYSNIQKDHNGFSLPVELCNKLDQDDFGLIHSLSIGKTVKEISWNSGIPYSTINFRIKSLLKLFGAKTTTELIRIFFDQQSSFILVAKSRL
jgi:two-component system, NarL family, response regulator NreC